MEVDPEELRAFRDYFHRFQKNLTSAEEYIYLRGIRDKNIQVGIKALIPWLKEQRFEEPQDFKILFLGIFQQVERAWAFSVRDFEAKCLEEFTKRGMKRVRLRESDMPKLLLMTRRIWDEFAGKLYPQPLLDGIRKRLHEFRSEKKKQNQ